MRVWRFSEAQVLADCTSLWGCKSRLEFSMHRRLTPADDRQPCRPDHQSKAPRKELLEIMCRTTESLPSKDFLESGGLEARKRLSDYCTVRDLYLRGTVVRSVSRVTHCFLSIRQYKYPRNKTVLNNYPSSWAITRVKGQCSGWKNKCDKSQRHTLNISGVRGSLRVTSDSRLTRPRLISWS